MKLLRNKISFGLFVMMVSIGMTLTTVPVRSFAASSTPTPPSTANSGSTTDPTTGSSTANSGSATNPSSDPSNATGSTTPPVATPTPAPAPTPTKITEESFKVSAGVFYKNTQFINGLTEDGVRVMEVNVNDPTSKVEIGYDPSLNALSKTTSQALGYDADGNQVVGAINGSFFQASSPMYLISNQNHLINAGVLSTDDQYYVNQPIAFGVDKTTGKGMIDSYNLQLTYTHNGETFNISSLNRPRTGDTTILYTSDYGQYTNTNQYGREVVVSTPTHPDMKYGDTYTGTVVAVREKNDTTNVEIPENGFVLSGNGLGEDQLADLKVGDPMTLSVNIDDKWKTTNFMLGSGPMLVKDGKVALSMDPNSYRAQLVVPRTAVAINQTGTKIYFITVDGRQAGYSQGMNLPDFAKYLASLGVDRALNLDGGGSTTMAVRYPGQATVQLANNPSNGLERPVSTMLMAVSTATPTQLSYYTDVQDQDSDFAAVHWLTSKGISGYSDGSFGVNKVLTRQHAAIMFSKVVGLAIPTPDQAPALFKDVKADDPYAAFIAAVGQAGIFNGSSGSFLPDKPITREQMATTLVNAFGLKDQDKLKADQHVKVNLDNVSDSHKQSVQLLADLGITNQLDNFHPKKYVTRGQFAKFMYLSRLKGQ